MKNNITELVFILDRSGSMEMLADDAIGGFNATMKKQREQEGRVYVSTYLFDTFVELIHDRVDISETKPMTKEDYQPGGTTSLLDAIGEAISHIEMIHRYVRAEDVPEHTVFVIMTDGMENSSHAYTSAKIKEKITQKQQECAWEFIFIAANIDAVETASSIGISKDRAANWEYSSNGMKVCHGAISRKISDIRENRNENIRLKDYLKEDKK